MRALERGERTERPVANGVGVDLFSAFGRFLATAWSIRDPPEATFVLDIDEPARSQR